MMDNASPPEDPSKLPHPASDGDIPVAQRDTSDPIASPHSFNKEFWILGGTAVAIATLAGGFLAWGTAPVEPSQVSVPAEAADVAENTDTADTRDVADPAASTNALAADEAILDEALLGHLPYDEALAEDLVPVVPDGSILMRQAAADKFLQMVEAAAADGILLVPVSGFRSIEDQEYLFFEVKAERGQVAATRAEVSAPPGYSEHHTGYAIDIIDGRIPDIVLVEAFETTPAFAWLQDNAAFYSFELSFPRDNAQGISYEPWHWRFVGDRHSLETFYRATTLQEAATPSTDGQDVPESTDAPTPEPTPES
jgi:zinc D-Ala-D-Ala carboxypeptidase